MVTRYNERSWAIDLISEINRICGKRTRPIMRAGGESTISTEEGSLFPDVLLFARDPADAILQGWELKMPDTSITDSTLYEKARTKARALRLNSFLLWNVKTAQLYTSADLTEYTAIRTWNVSGVDSREQVLPAREGWVRTLEQILDDLNDLFEKGVIEGRRFIESFSEHILVDSILENVPAVSKALRDEARINAAFDAEVRQWWLTVKSEYHGEKVPWEVLAKSNILSLINKFVFAHVLKVYHTSAGQVDEITGASSLQDALSIFGDISGRCDFWPVFQPTLGQTALTPKTWSQIVQLNQLLSQLRFPQIGQDLLGRLLEGAVEAAKRKISGQYVTPAPVAELLVRLTLRNKEDAFYDPFCGTGTIARAAYEMKLAYGIDPAQAIDKVWASD
ncbi:MAG: N-6 DNA methylase, partial [Planctomycetota bacterium]|nr:N-6 DNA methylase [Planctomycetota bacterium]